MFDRDGHLLLSDIQFLQDSPVALDIVLSKVIQHASSLTNKADQ